MTVRTSIPPDDARAAGRPARRAHPLAFVLPLLVGLAAGGAAAERASGYAEYRRPGEIVVDGQRIHATGQTQYRGSGIRSLDDIPLGFEVDVHGTRAPDGAVLAASVSAKPNGTALYEKEVLAATNQIESEWVSRGMMYEPGPNGKTTTIGEITDKGPRADRVRRIVDRLRPSYVGADRLRVHVVSTKEWNAAAMGNGAIWVYSGLLDETSDNEMAIVLGHELAHYTHEHSRRNARRTMLTQLVGLGALIASSSIDNDAARTSAMLGSLLGLTAFQSGYSRDLEDQADRVGLRYAHEGGYDVRTGPGLWGRFRRKYGQSDRVSNFFFGSHSRPSDRIRNVEREIALNYR